MAETLKKKNEQKETKSFFFRRIFDVECFSRNQKLRSEEHAVRVHEVSEQDVEEDVILSAFNMTGELSDTLQNILKKLDKLDSIEKSMNDFNATLLKLEGRVQSLESCDAWTRSDVDDIKESLNSIEMNRQETTQSLKKNAK